MSRRRDPDLTAGSLSGWPPDEPLFASVVVAESKAVVLTGMRALIESTDEFDLIGTASSLRDLRGLLRSRKTDVVVVGLRVLGDAGKDLRALRRLAGTHAVVAVADALRPVEVLGVLEAGVRAVMLTETTGDCLRASIRAAARGQLFVDPLLMPVPVDAALKGMGGITGPLGLTVQERRVVSYLPGRTDQRGDRPGTGAVGEFVAFAAGRSLQQCWSRTTHLDLGVPTGRWTF